MQAYRVTHMMHDTHYYLLADTPAHAVEIVTLTVADAGGSAGWEARPVTPPYSLAEGTVLDAEGKPVARAAA